MTKINSIGMSPYRHSCYDKHINFGARRSREYVNQKREYIDNKTEGAFELGAALFILGLLMKGHNVEFKKGISAGQKFGVACIIASALTMFGCAIAKLFIGSKYDKERNSNDSKSNA